MIRSEAEEHVPTADDRLDARLAYYAEVSKRYQPSRRPRLGEALLIAMMLWWRPLWAGWRCYCLGVGGYLAVRLAGWALVTTQADLVTSAADARELGRQALLEAGPVIGGLLFMLYVCREMPRCARRFGDVYAAIAAGVRRLRPSVPRTAWVRVGRWALVTVGLVAAACCVAVCLDALFAVATIDTRTGPGWALRNALLIWSMVPLSVIGGGILFAWAWPSATGAEA